MSWEVSHIDAFISHNWSVSRATKFLCLCFVFNLDAALLAVGAAYAVAAAAGLLGFRGGIQYVVPIFAFEPDMGTIETGTLTQMLVPPVFILVGLFGRDLQHLLSNSGCMVFLDKTCRWRVRL